MQNDSLILLNVKAAIKDAYVKLSEMEVREPALEAEFIRLHTLINSYIGGRYKEATECLDMLFDMIKD